jgi:hypothetical protein
MLSRTVRRWLPILIFFASLLFLARSEASFPKRFFGPAPLIVRPGGTNSPKPQIWIGKHYEEKDGETLFHVFAGGQRLAANWCH